MDRVSVGNGLLALVARDVIVLRLEPHVEVLLSTLAEEDALEEVILAYHQRWCHRVSFQRERIHAFHIVVGFSHKSTSLLVLVLTVQVLR